MRNNILEDILPLYTYESDFSIHKNLKIYDFSAYELRNLVYESESYAVRSIKRDIKRHYTTVLESLITTYPVKNFIKNFLYCISNVLKQKDLEVSVTENAIDIKEQYIYHNPQVDYIKNNENINTIFFNYGLNEYEDGVNYRVIAATLNLENKIAGNVMFIIEAVDFNRLSSISIIKKQISDNLEKLSIAGKFCGYNYVTTIKFDNQIVIKYESEYKKDNLFIPKYLYHVTASSLKDKILRKGLIPKSNSYRKNRHKETNKTTTEDDDIEKLYHPDRVYMFTKNDDSLFKTLIADFIKKSRKFDELNGELQLLPKFTVFRIDVDKLYDFHLFCDNEYPNSDIHRPEAVYTYNNIPPYAISVEKEITL